MPESYGPLAQSNLNRVRREFKIAPDMPLSADPKNPRIIRDASRLQLGTRQDNVWAVNAKDESVVQVRFADGRSVSTPAPSIPLELAERSLGLPGNVHG